VLLYESFGDWGAGFIGSHTMDLLLAGVLRLLFLDNLGSGRLENVSQHMSEKGFRFVQGDVRDSVLLRI